TAGQMGVHPRKLGSERLRRPDLQDTRRARDIDAPWLLWRFHVSGRPPALQSHGIGRALYLPPDQCDQRLRSARQRPEIDQQGRRTSLAESLPDLEFKD